MKRSLPSLAGGSPGETANGQAALAKSASGAVLESCYEPYPGSARTHSFRMPFVRHFDT
jgi:hypothetical protein